MSLQHARITRLPPQAVFEALLNLGGHAQEYVEKRRKAGIWPSSLISFYGAPPSEKIARLLLHIAFEDKSLILNSHLGFYLYTYSQKLSNMAQPLNHEGWENAAMYVMAAMDNRIQIYYDDNKWDIICSTEIRQVKEIRDLIKSLEVQEVKTSWKNVIYGSTINANTVIVGDTIRVDALTNQQIKTFRNLIEQMLANGYLLQSLQALLDFSNTTFPEIYQNTQKLLGLLYVWQQKRVNSEMPEAQIEVYFRHIHMETLKLIQKL